MRLRAAHPLDAGVLGQILHGFAAETDWMPDLHSKAETIAYCGSMIDRNWVSVAEQDGRPAAFLARDGAVIHALYVQPAARGQGLGRALLSGAKAQTDRLELWTFQANHGAQRFYMREGFIEMRRTDGAGNDERLPDILFGWRAEPKGKPEA